MESDVVSKKPKVCLYADRPNWAYDFSAKEIANYLSDEFEIDIKYVIDNPVLDRDEYDLFLVYFWGEDSYKKYRIPKNKIIKKVSSHRWQYSGDYGPISPRQFCKKYLNDAGLIYCNSQILFDLLNKYGNNIILCGDGYSSELFKFMQRRTGAMSICMVGNTNDPIKGVNDILKPAAKGFKLEIQNNMNHVQLCDFYNNNDIYAVTSLSESNPLPLMESMACGCFPVASKVGIAPEIIRHKENGYLVDERSVEGFEQAFNWCECHIGYIRDVALNIAEEIYCKRRWEIMSEGYRQMFRFQLEKQKKPWWML